MLKFVQYYSGGPPGQSGLVCLLCSSHPSVIDHQEGNHCNRSLVISFHFFCKYFIELTIQFITIFCVYSKCIWYWFRCTTSGRAGWSSCSAGRGSAGSGPPSRSSWSCSALPTTVCSADRARHTGAASNFGQYRIILRTDTGEPGEFTTPDILTSSNFTSPPTRLSAPSVENKARAGWSQRCIFLRPPSGPIPEMQNTKYWTGDRNIQHL